MKGSFSGTRVDEVGARSMAIKTTPENHAGLPRG